MRQKVMRQRMLETMRVLFFRRESGAFCQRLEDAVPRFAIHTATVARSENEFAFTVAFRQPRGYPNHRTFVIRDRTATGTHTRDLLPYAYLSEEAFSDFQAKNKEQYRLENKLSVTPPCVFISKEKEDSLFPLAHITSIDSDTIKQMQNNWNQFYREYPAFMKL